MSLMEAKSIVNRYRKDLPCFVEYDNGFRFFKSINTPEQDLVVHKVTKDVYSVGAYFAEYPEDFETIVA